MRQLLLSMAFSVLSVMLFAQDNTKARTNSDLQIDNSTNLNRYGVDYEVLEYDFQGDSTILEQIDLRALEQYRRYEYVNRVEDPNTGLIILLYPGKRNDDSPTPTKFIEE